MAPEKPKHNRDAAQAEYRDKVKKAKARTEAAQKLLDDLLFQLNERQGKVAPHPYYAVLLADGDKMGSSISEAKTIGANQEISKRLSRFAELVGETVKEAKGTLIYAGGDDVLALLPLHTALECTRKLADQFKATLDGAPTLSAGLAIVHHLEPLSEALTLARKAEKAAKAIPGKNALAVTLSKRSGSEEDHRWKVGRTGCALANLHRLGARGRAVGGLGLRVARSGDARACAQRTGICRDFTNLAR